MIEIMLTAQEETRSREKSCFYLAECVADGIAYEARSRHGASFALARVLVDASVADQQVRVVQRGHKGHLQYGSLHEMALWTISEGRSALQRVKWVDQSAVFSNREASKTRVKPVSASPVPSERFIA